MSSFLMTTSGFIALTLVLLAFLGTHIVRSDESGVVFMLGHLKNVKGPGVYWMLPLITRIVKVRLHPNMLKLPPQKIITRDLKAASITTDLSFKVVDPVAAVMSVVDLIQAITQVSLTTLHNALGQLELAELLTQQEQINKRLQAIINEHMKGWGIEVTAMEIQYIHPLVDW